VTTDYEVLAIRHGDQQTTKSHCYYRYSSYREPDADIGMDFFFWLIRNENTTILVDTGWSVEAVAARPPRRRLADAREAVGALGTDPDSISHVIVTHMHYDHTGNLPEFPSARIVVQAEEVGFWTSRYGAYPPMAAPSESAEIAYIQAAIKRGAADVVEGPATVLPGIRVVPVGGHTPGQQIVIVEGRQDIVLASDALHYYEEMDRDRPYELFTNIFQMYDAYAELRRMRDDGAIIVAGHDPLVMERFALVESTDPQLQAVRISS